MVNTIPAVFKVVPTTQQYDWGRKGRSSSVAQFADAYNIEIDDGSPYAELWMGTHSKSPSHVLLSGQTLSSHLASHPDLIGTPILNKFRDEGAKEGNLPFLLKVLSVEKALSIQTHPDKRTAEILYKQQPDIYKDANHKPEMALALTPFQALCGFRPLTEIAFFLGRTPEFRDLIPPSILSAFLSICNSSDPEGQEEKVALKNIFSSIMTTPEDQVRKQLDALLERYAKGVNESDDNEVVDLVTRLGAQFPGDVGIFCAFMLNFVKLQPGEAIFLGAGEPHAYVYGECIECMANSDNVIRAGLTPKLRDVPNLVSGLTYSASPPSKHVVDPRPFATSAASMFYDPPIPEFSVVRTILPDKNEKHQEKHRAVGGPSLVIVTEGSGIVSWGIAQTLLIGRGDVFFVGANIGLEFESKETLVMFRAFVES